MLEGYEREGEERGERGETGVIAEAVNVVNACNQATTLHFIETTLSSFTFPRDMTCQYYAHLERYR